MSLFKRIIKTVGKGVQQHLKEIKENDKCSLSYAEMEVARYEGQRERNKY